MFDFKMLPKDSKPYKHFKKAWGSRTRRGAWRRSVARCGLVKHTSCREGKCSVKKQVQCLSVCPVRVRKHKLGRRKGKLKNPWVGTNSPDCGRRGRRVCTGYYTDAKGKRQSYGALACSQVATMA